jgi:hypothetical protein
MAGAVRVTHMSNLKVKAMLVLRLMLMIAVVLKIAWSYQTIDRASRLLNKLRVDEKINFRTAKGPQGCHADNLCSSQVVLEVQYCVDLQKK